MNSYPFNGNPGESKTVTHEQAIAMGCPNYIVISSKLARCLTTGDELPRGGEPAYVSVCDPEDRILTQMDIC